MIIKQDPVTKLWCREDGKVLMPPCPTCRTPRHTYKWSSGRIDAHGYLAIVHHNKKHQVHRIIARAFLPNPDGLPTVDHTDRDPKNNAVSNLRWADYKTQNDNRTNVLNRVDYGARSCDDKKVYQARYGAAYRAKMKAKGLVKRKCPDGKQHWVKQASE